MIRYLFRHDKDYSRFNIIKKLTKDLKLQKDIYILLPFSKNQFLKFFLKRALIVNDFFISNYDTYVYDRQKISKKSPRAWWKFFQDWINFRFSKYLLSDTQAHFNYWEKLFGKFSGKHIVIPVLADKTIYYPALTESKNESIKILFYGSFIPLHGIDIILNAFSIMERNNVKFEATVIGNGQMYNKMKKLHDDLDLKNISMNGKMINEKDLASKIREFDIVLGIFGNTTKAKSVVPNKVYQSMACAKCTVTMKSEVLKEFFDSKDLITCDNNADSLAETLSELSNNDSLVKEVSRNGYISFMKLYSETEKKLHSFIKSI